MSGKYNGLQAKVREKNRLASWIPCWSCRADATKALKHDYQQIKDVLKQIDEVKKLTSKRLRCEAKGLLRHINHLETGIYNIFWNDILQRTDVY